MFEIYEKMTWWPCLHCIARTQILENNFNAIVGSRTYISDFETFEILHDARHSIYISIKIYNVAFLFLNQINLYLLV